MFPRWNLHSAAALGPHATVAVSSAEARSKGVCSHLCGSGVARAVGMWWYRASSWRRGNGVASAWGPHLQQGVEVPDSLSCGSGGEQKLHPVGGGSIQKLQRALPGRNVVLSLLGARRSTAGTVAPGTYSTCYGGR